MNDDLLEGDSPERRSLLPGHGFFVPDSIETDLAADDAAETLAEATVVVVADPDADGLAALALLREVYEDAVLLPTSPYELSVGLASVAELGDPETVLICDLCPDTLEQIEAPLLEITDTAAVRWFDHHQWDDRVRCAVRDAGVELEIGDSDTECTADVVARAVSAEYPEHLLELVAVTRDHDLWINEDPRSEDLADYAHWIEPEEYVEVVREHGPDLPDDAVSLLEERRVEKRDRIQRAVRRADRHEFGDLTVGVTYGRCSQNEVAEELREDGADAAVIVKPAGSASIRGSAGFERCHEVAGLVGGGGHPRAAGCKPDVHRDMLDFARHWTTEGAVTKQVILEAFRDVLESSCSEASENEDDASDAV